jgi:type IV pilus assembly protein PilW
MSSHEINRSRRLEQSGLTLVEILVALIIGMLVVLAATASMLGTRRTALTGGDVDELHQSSALAFRVLGQQIRQAGYVPIDERGPRFRFNVNDATLLADEPAFFAIKGAEAASTSGNDTLKVGYAPSPDHFEDCLGQAAKPYDPADPASPRNVRLITSEFSVGDGALRCRGSGKAGQSQPIVMGVERFDVQYGIAGADGNQPARYVTATEAGDFKLVRTVRICLQLAGMSTSNPDGSHTDCDGVSQSSRDGRLRRVYTAVFALRNP